MTLMNYGAKWNAERRRKMMSNLIERDQKSEIVNINPAQKLIEMAISSNADIDKLERLMAMQDAWEKKNAERDFLDAMSRFQAKCPDITKAKKGHNYMYAPLSDIVSQTRELISACGLSYRFEQKQENGCVEITCVVSHTSGHSVRTSLSSPPDTSGSKNAIQAIGSAVQYLMRYTFIGSFGITTADDDMDGRLPASNDSPPASAKIISEIKSICESKGRDVKKLVEYVASAFKDDLTTIDDMTQQQAEWAIKALEKAK